MANNDNVQAANAAMDTPPDPPPAPAPRRALPQKNFEKVVAALLPHVKVSYVPLPPIPSSCCVNDSSNHGNENDADTDMVVVMKGDKTTTNDDDNDWPFGGLPPAARVFGTLEGQLSNRQRAQRKEDQLRSMLRCIFALLPSSSSSSSSSAASSTKPDDSPIQQQHQHQQHQHQQQGSSESVEPFDECARSRRRPFTIVDFGGGSGHLAIPLALLLQQREKQEHQQQQQQQDSSSARRPMSCRVIVVDLGKRSLDLLHKKASHCGGSGSGGGCVTEPVVDEDVAASSGLCPCDGIPNLFTFHGPVEEFNDVPFDMGIALHLCGEATDVALGKCCSNAVASLVFCPCCVGKLNAQRKNPYIWQATGTNRPTISYPRSTIFQQCISTKEDWNALAQAADYSSHSNNINNNDSINDSSDRSPMTTSTATPHESRTSSNAIRRTAKALVETDRLLFLQEQTRSTSTSTYETALTRMMPWEATPKNDIIMAWQTKRNDSASGGGRGGGTNHELNTATKSSAITTRTIARQPWMDDTDVECEADIQQTRNLLVANSAKHGGTHHSVAAENHSYASATVNGAIGVRDSIYWTAQEEMEIRNQLQDFFFNKNHDGHCHHANSSCGSSMDDDQNAEQRRILIFPTGMGRRRRKLVHHVAELLNLAHWCEGRKAGDKTVAVALRRTPHPPLPAAATTCAAPRKSHDNNELPVV